MVLNKNFKHETKVKQKPNILYGFQFVCFFNVFGFFLSQYMLKPHFYKLDQLF